MQTIEEAKKRCKFVAEGISKVVTDGKCLVMHLKDSQNVLSLFEKDENGCLKIVGGWIGKDDSGAEVSERGVFMRVGDEYVGTAFDAETSIAMREFFEFANRFPVCFSRGQ